MSTIALNTSSAIGNAAAADTGAPVRIAVKNLNFHYGDFRSLKSISLDFYDRQVTALIGPSGCGKSTLLRTFNRIYSLYPDQRAEGEIILDGRNILSPNVDVNELRARVGMVFQKPTPFPMSIYDNVAFGLRLYEKLPKAEIEDLIEQLRREFAIVIVTHNMQQAARISQFTAFMYLGELVEFGETSRIFMNPAKKQTQDYITGRFG